MLGRGCCWGDTGLAGEVGTWGLTGRGSKCLARGLGIGTGATLVLGTFLYINSFFLLGWLLLFLSIV